MLPASLYQKKVSESVFLCYLRLNMKMLIVKKTSGADCLENLAASNLGMVKNRKKAGTKKLTVDERPSTVFKQNESPEYLYT